MEFRRLGRFINLSLVVAFTTLFISQAVAQTESSGDVQDVTEQSTDVVEQDAPAQPSEPAKKSFLEGLLEVAGGVAEQAIEETASRETRKAQGYYKGKIESINVVEQRGNSIIVDIAFRDIKQREGAQLRVSALSAGASYQELSNFQGNISGNSGTSRVLMHWSNPLNQPEIKTDQLEVVLYRETGGVEETIDKKYTSLHKTWTPFDEVVDPSGQVGGLDLDDEPADVEDLSVGDPGEETCNSAFVWKSNHWERRRAGDTTCYPNQPAGAPNVRDNRDSGTPPAGRPSAPKSTYIKARANQRLCFHKKHDGWANGNPVHLWACNAGKAGWKMWVYERSTGYVRSRGNPSKCIHKQQDNWKNGNRLHLWDCKSGRPEFKSWDYDPRSGLIRARHNKKKCIHKKNNNWNNGNVLHLWDCGSSHDRMKTWRL